MHPAMCGATGLVLISTINCIFLSSLSLLAQLRMTGGCCHHPASSDFTFSLHSTACCAQVWVMRTGGVCVCVCEGDAAATAGFRRVSPVDVASSARHAGAGDM